MLLAAFAQGMTARAGERTFDFTYAFTVTGLQPSQQARVWVPAPAANDAQTILRAGAHKKLPKSTVTTGEPVFNNGMLYFLVAAGPDGAISASYTSRITRKSIDHQQVYANEKTDGYLKPDALVPTDERVADAFGVRSLPAEDFAKARALYDIVYDGLTYSKVTPGYGRGDVKWVCNTRSGNCSDFHSLFVSLARQQLIPAKMEFGFVVPTADQLPKIEGYHCWAFFKPREGNAWIPVDISTAKKNPELKDFYFGHLDENRVTFSTGRDVTLEPKQDGPPLNFFVFPYVEVNGRPWPQEQVQPSLSAVPVTDLTSDVAPPAAP